MNGAHPLSTHIKSKQKNRNIYRPQTNLRKGNVFTPVCDSVHRGGVHPPGRHRPPPDGHCSGRYASYWNAFLWKLVLILSDLAYDIEMALTCEAIFSRIRVCKQKWK